MNTATAIEWARNLVSSKWRGGHFEALEDAKQEVVCLVLENLDPDKPEPQQVVYLGQLAMRAIDTVRVRYFGQHQSRAKGRFFHTDVPLDPDAAGPEDETAMVERIDVWRATEAVERTGIEHPRAALLAEQLVKFQANELPGGWA
jgi:hypothetical protein